MAALDSLILAAFVLFMIFLVRGFVVQMRDKNENRKSKKRDENEI
ncbi:hypothetical protein [Campylobacter sp.]|nr:hypothetical protein [Campylobacter sp.]